MPYVAGWRTRGTPSTSRSTGTDGEWFATENAYDALVLDVMLPGLAGDELCARLRQAGNWVPILMLTARSGPAEEARALDAGSRRLPGQAVLVRGADGPASAPCCAAAAPSGRLSSRPATWASTRPSTACGAASSRSPLTPRQFSLLEFLMRRAGEVLPKATILEHVWDFSFEGDPNIVEVYVGQLRQRIDEPFGRAALQTVRLVGYRLDPEGG